MDRAKERSEEAKERILERFHLGGEKVEKYNSYGHYGFRISQPVMPLLHALPGKVGYF